MNQKRKKVLLSRLEKYLVQLQENAGRSQKALQYLSEQALSSWSIAGERKHAETELKLVQDLLEKARKVSQEVASSLETDIIKAIPPCFVTIELDGDKKKEDRFYFLETSLQIPGLKTVSPSSPLGQAILNKRAGERFSYQAVTLFSGTIKKVE